MSHTEKREAATEQLSRDTQVHLHVTVFFEARERKSAHQHNQATTFTSH